MNSSPTFRVLAVDDDETVLDRLKSVLPRYTKEIGHVVVDVCLSFDEAEERLKAFGSSYDLVILDVMDSHPFSGTTEDGSRGTTLYERIRKVRWLPVIFYTAIPENVEVQVEAPMVVVVSKENTNLLRTSVVESLQSGAARVARTLVEELDSGVRSFLATHVSPNWDAYKQQDETTLQRLLMNRLSAWLREWSTPPGQLVPSEIGGSVPASAYYLLPPLEGSGLRAGSILTDNSGESWIVLTPSCDLYTGGVRSAKVERVLLAKLIRAEHQSEVAKYLSASERSNSLKSKAITVLQSQHHNPRWFFLPSFLSIPNLFVDLEHLSSVSYQDVLEWKRVADLDTPFIESLLARQSHWRGRIGTPDLVVDPHLSEMLAAHDSQN